MNEMDNKEFWSERDKRNWSNGKYLRKKSFYGRKALARLNAQLEVATKKSVKNRLLKEKAELEAELKKTRDGISEIALK